MSGFLSPPTFNPPVTSIPLGTVGQVLTMVGNKPQFAGATGGGIGSSINFAPASGVIDPAIAGACATGTVTVKVCAIVALTPTASVYNVRVFQ